MIDSELEKIILQIILEKKEISGKQKFFLPTEEIIRALLRLPPRLPHKDTISRILSHLEESGKIKNSCESKKGRRGRFRVVEVIDGN